MRFFVYCVVVIIDLAVGAGVGFGAGAAAIKVVENASNKGSMGTLLVVSTVVVGLAIATLMGMFQWRWFRARYRPCPSCTSYLRREASRCPYCQADI